MVERRQQPYLPGQQHAVTEHVATHVADRDHRERMYELLVAVGPERVLITDAELLVSKAAGREALRNRLFLADTYAAHGGREAALKSYRALAAEVATAPLFRAQVGRRLLDVGEPEDAEAVFRDVLAAAPDLIAAHEGMADVLETRSPGQALAHLDRLEALSPGRPETSYRRGTIHEASRDSQQSVSAYAEFLRRAPESGRDDPFFLRQRAHATYRIGKPVEALEILEAGRQAYPDAAEMVNAAATILIDLKRYDEALTLLETVGGGGVP